MELNHLRQLQTSQTLLINEQSKVLESQGKKLVRFGFGQSPFSPPYEVIESLKSFCTHHDYVPVQGILSLRQELAKFHKPLLDIEINPKQIIVGPGSKMLIYSVMAAFKKAEVFIPVPAWVSYQPQALLLGHNVTKIITEFEQNWQLQPEKLDSALSQVKSDAQKILILNYPSNPNGHSFSEEQLRALAMVAVKHNLLIISDEIYGLLDFDGNYRSIVKYYPQGTIITSGLSKWCGAGGWRFGYAIVPLQLQHLTETLTGIASETYSCVATPVQMAAQFAYNTLNSDSSYLKHQRRILALAGRYSASKLREVGIKVHDPLGGFYLFIDFNNLKTKLSKWDITTSQQLCQRILNDAGVALLPGDAFGMEEDYLSARLAFVDFDGMAALKVSEEIGLNKNLDQSFLNERCPKVVLGINNICAWVSSII